MANKKFRNKEGRNKSNEIDQRSTSKSTSNRRRKRGSYTDDDNSNKNRTDGYKNGNDASWYTANPQLLKDAANIPFFVPLGSKMDPLPSMPGIMILRYAPAFGVSENASSPINIAARNVYSFIRHANSGHTNYESPDLMMYLLAMDSAYAYHAGMTRAYGILNTFSQTNKYLPKRLLESLGFDYTDLVSNLANFRYYINQYAVKLGSLVVPNAFTYYQRHIWMNSNLYFDEDSIKGQIFAYKQQGFYVFQEVTSETGSSLKYKTFSGAHKLADIIKMGDELLNALVNSEDINIMSGDILKAYGDNTMKVGVVPEDYSVLPVYNSEVLNQIHNTMFIGSITDSDLTVTQVDGNIISRPKYNQTAAMWAYFKNPPTLDLNDNNPTPELVMVATRNMFMIDPSASSAGDQYVGTCSTELFMDCYMYTMDEAILLEDVSMKTASLATDIPTAAKRISCATTFSRAPYIRVFLDDKEIDYLPIGQYENYTTVPFSVLKNLNETALLSMFDVPQMGRVK